MTIFESRSVVIRFRQNKPVRNKKNFRNYLSDISHMNHHVRYYWRSSHITFTRGLFSCRKGTTIWVRLAQRFPLRIFRHYSYKIKNNTINIINQQGYSHAQLIFDINCQIGVVKSLETLYMIYYTVIITAIYF